MNLNSAIVKGKRRKPRPGRGFLCCLAAGLSDLVPGRLALPGWFRPGKMLFQRRPCHRLDALSAHSRTPVPQGPRGVEKGHERGLTVRLARGLGGTDAPSCPPFHSAENALEGRASG